MSRRIIAAILVFGMLLGLASCGGENTASELVSSDSVWMDSNLIGVIQPEDDIRVQDDFAAAVNKDWKLEMGDTHSGLFDDIGKAVLKKKKLAATDASIPGETARALREYYQLASDWAGRDRDGTAPLQKYVDDIASIGSLEELYAFFCDRSRNPLGLSPVTVGVDSVVYSEERDRNVLFLSPPQLSMGQDGDNVFYYKFGTGMVERFEQVKELTAYLLARLGYDGSEAGRLLDDCIAFEKQIAAADHLDAVTELDEIVFDRDKVLSFAGRFPLDELLNAWGFSGCDVLAVEPHYAKKLSSLCTAGNLERVKAFLIVHYAMDCAQFLDREAYDRMVEILKSRQKAPVDTGMTDEELEDSLIFDTYIGSTAMVGAMNRVYVENYFDDDSIGELRSTTEEIIDGFREIFSAEEWLSEEGKAASREKLDAISIHIAYQDFDSVDYGKLNLVPREQGGNFLEAYFASELFLLDHLNALVVQPYDAAYWDPLSTTLSTTDTNAMYNAKTNGIYIFAGICEAPAYAPDMSREEKLAGIFSIVGHEITHGFDKTGAQYDKNGRKNNWLPSEDQQAFNDKNAGVGAYYSLLTPYPSAGMYNGFNVNGEATADMGGLRVALLLGSKEPNFDYDRFFRSYARLWRVNIPLEEEKTYFSGDSHPLAFYRINVGVQQFDEFYETYGVKEGDGMYLAPEARIKVW